MKSCPDVIELDEGELESKLDQIAAELGEGVAEPFRQLLHWYDFLDPVTAGFQPASTPAVSR
jgi:hypothetical protein